MCFEYDGVCEFYNECVRKARKDYKCISCNNGIRQGERYTNVSGKADGDLFAYKVCGACELDRYRIHIDELAEGCYWHESWCAPEELRMHREHTGMRHSNRTEGQEYFCVRERRLKQFESAYMEKLADG